MPDPSDLAVIVCSRERADMLELSLASIVAATPHEVEILVVDSASTTTATREVAEAAGVRYVRNDVKGLSIARNLGLDSTDREIVLYTDDDCRAVEGWVTSILAHFDDESVGAVTGRMLDHTLVDRETGGDRRARLTRTVSGLDGGHGALMAFRRALVQDLGGFDDVLGAGRELAGAEDLDMFCRVLSAGEAIIHDEDSVVHHVNTREGDAYTVLLHGYGLGLGALANKWIRLRLTVGVPLSAVLLKRTTVRALRNLRDPRRGPAERAMLRGMASGFLRAARMRLDGERFVDDHRPPAVSPVPSGRAALQ
jgi:glycosyltransferase involved in cell wall biosynthesis